jgi:hypothetical protein
MWGVLVKTAEHLLDRAARMRRSGLCVKPLAPSQRLIVDKVN